MKQDLKQLKKIKCNGNCSDEKKTENWATPVWRRPKRGGSFEIMDRTPWNLALMEKNV